ncbi:hypothetical protein E2C01_080560 [Portunus trituberculatus]|uniref:Uncharacterized protein n=1 Tax=Portunus trituberculatus TaxID=210409 RepID=A0A5B7IYP6_PORTR|nr:hypothetical protein [Portunus trituberculatus]
MLHTVFTETTASVCLDGFLFTVLKPTVFVEEVMTEAPQDERCTRFADNLVDNYVTAESRYPPVLWAEFPSKSCLRSECRLGFLTRDNGFLAGGL